MASARPPARQCTVACRVQMEINFEPATSCLTVMCSTTSGKMDIMGVRGVVGGTGGGGVPFPIRAPTIAFICTRAGIAWKIRKPTVEGIRSAHTIRDT
jgi:hypothetical protein